MSTIAPATTSRPRSFHPPRLTLGSFRLGEGFIGLLAGAILWEVLGRVGNQPFFPPLSAVLVRLGELFADGLIVENLINSLINLAIGFGISVVLGVGIGMLMGAYRKVEVALDIYVYAMLTAPSLVFAPIFFSIFGLSRASIVGVVVLYTMFIIIVNTTGAIKSVSPSLIEMGRSFCATDRQIFRRIILPAALPLIMAGIRLGMGRAVKGMINGEMFIAAVGLGAIVISAGKRFDAEAVLAILIVIVVVAFVTVKIVQLIDARMTSWLPSTARTRR